MTYIPAEVPGPNPGEPGHFAHHDWLTAAVNALDAGLTTDAEALATLMASLTPDLHEGFVWAGVSGFAHPPSNYALVRIGRFCLVQCRFVMTGTIASSSTGNIADTQMTGPIPEDMIPTDRIYGAVFSTSATQGMGRVNGVAQGASAGQMTITSLNSGAGLGSGGTVDILHTYWLT